MKILENNFLYDQMIATIEDPTPDSTPTLSDGADQVFEDADAAYEYWVNQPCFDTDDSHLLKNLIKTMESVNEIQLNLQKESAPKFIANIMIQHAAQITLPEALLMNEYLNNPITQSCKWNITYSMDKESQQANHIMTKKGVRIIIQHKLQSHEISIMQNSQCIGALSVDIEGQVIEKIHGQYQHQPFILDPIWTHQQNTINSEKIMLGQFKTEIVHHQKHKQTLWQGASKNNLMMINKNKTYQINQNLFFNKKHLKWPNFKLISYQWFCPWQRLPIGGEYYLISDKNKKKVTISPAYYTPY